MKTNMSIQSFIQSEKDRFDGEFPNWRMTIEPKYSGIHIIEEYQVDAFLSSSHAKNLERMIGMVEGMKDNTILPTNPKDWEAQDFAVKSYNSALIAFKELLSRELEQIRKI